MSTRAAIARPNGDGFLGRYHHWDGYPEGLGATLYLLAQPNRILEAAGLPLTPWDGDVEKMLAFLLDEHTGWSTINGKDMRRTPGMADDKFMRGTCTCGKGQQDHFCQYSKDEHAPGVYPCNGGEPVTDGFSNRHLGHLFEETEESKAAGADADLAPECYCHGTRSEEGWAVDEHNASGSGVEYTYVIDAASRKMTVLSSYAEFDGEKQKMIGFFGMGAEDAEWQPIGYVDFDMPPPDWKAMYEAQYEDDDFGANDEVA